MSELSRLLLAEGRDYCALLVEAGNAAAQRVYQRAGYQAVGELAEIGLEG
jgi:predicted GNAT family acetyltransferase